VCRRQGWLCLLILVPLILTVGYATVTRQAVPPARWVSSLSPGAVPMARLVPVCWVAGLNGEPAGLYRSGGC
jgi:hypothetical protein